MTESSPGFVLRGTHGAIFPWSPPPGLPRRVLQAMREQLLIVFYNAFRILSVRPQSAQTSPAKSQFTRRLEDWRFDMWGVPPQDVVLPSSSDSEDEEEEGDG